MPFVPALVLLYTSNSSTIQFMLRPEFFHADNRENLNLKAGPTGQLGRTVH